MQDTAPAPASAVDAHAPDPAPASGADAHAADPAPASPADLANIRGEIERIDRAIIDLIAERVALARQVGPVKRALGVPTLDPPREAEVVRRAGALAREAGLADEDVRYVFWHLVGLCRRAQLESD